MDKVTAFPFLTADEFVHACKHAQSLLPGSALVRDHLDCLRITRHLAVSPPDKADQARHDETAPEIIEVDHDALVIAPRNEMLLTVRYDVLLSPSYRVPVVYLTLQPPLPVSQLFDLLVPLHLRHPMRETGIMGALTMTDHPATGMPAYFVHPCRTADAMCATGRVDVSILDYMLIWMGVVGASVGLNVSSTDLCRV